WEDEKVESRIVVTIALLDMFVNLDNILRHTKVEGRGNPGGQPEKTTQAPQEAKSDLSCNLLILFFCLLFGAEVGFKRESKKIIHLLQPCTVVGMIAILLLDCPPCLGSAITFKLRMKGINASRNGVLFPLPNTLMTFEMESHYVTQVYLYVIRLYILLKGRSYPPNPLSTFKWAVLVTELLFGYHFTLLQINGVASESCLPTFLCPSIS
uniref:Uncharacterized protein n=1 Tax=Callithrix jacchus TaxID=9483 RepID=A0A8I3WQ02_CALJA